MSAKRTGVVVAGVVLALLAAVGSVEAAWPGQNGRIVFTQFTSQRQRFETPFAYLCSSEPAGGGQSKLTPGLSPGGNVDGPVAFSPDGAAIAFLHGATTSIGWLSVAPADGTGARRLGDVFGSTPAWSADGRWIYLAQTGDLVRVSLADATVERLTATPGVFEDSPAESPDGTRLAYVSSTQADVPRRSLVVRSLDGSTRTLAAEAGLREPHWSPDGSRLVFSAGQALWSAQADGSGLHQLTSGHTDAAPAYSPDGRRIVFVRDGDVWTIAADGTDPVQVTATPVNEYNPAWQQREASVQASGSAPCALTGTEGDDVLVGSDGVDFFYDRGGDDVIRGLGGDDYVLDGAGADAIDAGDGADIVRLASGPNTVSGGPGDDWVLFQLPGADPSMVDAGPGDDRLDGSTGADRILGGDGDDVLSGLGGADLLFGGPGRDRVVGNRGDDVVDGGPDDDVLYGGRISGLPFAYDGYDLLRGGAGADRLAGGWQRDRLFGGAGADRLAGGRHGDYLKGEGGRDVLVGEAGDDLLLARGDGALDDLWGGPGFDRATVDTRDHRRGVERVLR